MRKKCQNPECGKTIVEYKSSKKIYCDNHCRNRAGYINRSVENKNLIDFQKGLKNNVKLLKQFVDKGFNKIPFSIINQLGFNTTYLPVNFIAKKEGKQLNVFKLNSIVFGFDNETKEIIIYEN